MLAWKRLPVVMAPEESYDNFGCFSGSALELSDGRHLLMYTGVGYVGDTPMANGELPTHQTQCMAVGDGVNYEKYENNPVITGDDIPEGGSKVDFRDPKIWKEDDGYFYAVISNMTDDGNSRILLYRSPDGFKWEYVTVLDHSDAKLGKMWECPDFYEVDGKTRSCSKSDGNASGRTEIPRRSQRYLPDRNLRQRNTQICKRRCTAARQWNRFLCSTEHAHTRRPPCNDRMDAGMAELQVRSGRSEILRTDDCSERDQLPQWQTDPAAGKRDRELSWRAGQHHNVEISEETALDGIKGRVLDMTVKLKVTDDFSKFAIKLAADDTYSSYITYDPAKEVLNIDRSRSGYLYDILHTRDIQVKPVDGEVTLRILMDKFSVEIFINDGSQTATMVLFTPQEADQITFAAEGKAEISIDKYNLVF